MRFCSWDLFVNVWPISRGVAGGKAVGRWCDGMLGWDDFIANRRLNSQNRAVGIKQIMYKATH